MYSIVLDGETTTPILNKLINTGYTLLFITENRYAEAHSAATVTLLQLQTIYKFLNHQSSQKGSFICAILDARDKL